MICESCGKEKEDAVECLDPFILDVHNEEVEVVLCSDCYQQHCDDI